MSIKKTLVRIFYFGYSSDKNNESKKLKYRNLEWCAIENYIKGDSFLDVGCGSGFHLDKVKKRFNNNCHGIDPMPGKIGVQMDSETNIIKGCAENIPFPDNTFDTVFSSHVFEHVDDIVKSGKEVNRVSNKDAVIIIGVPTSTMSWIYLFSSYLFTTHVKLAALLFGRILNLTKIKYWWEILIPISHTTECSPMWYDLKNYRIKKWEKIMSELFHVEEIIYPCLHSFPEFRQILPTMKLTKLGSSVFFVCKPKKQIK